MNKISRITAVSITIYARKTALEISKIKYLPEYSCTKNFLLLEEDSFLPYSINFICKSNLVRRSQYQQNNFVVIFFTSEISCEQDCNYKLKKDDNVDLYEIVEDDCYKPDSPIYGHSRSWPLNRTAKNLNTSSSSTTTLKSITNKIQLTNLSTTKSFNNRASSMKTTPLPITTKKLILNTATPLAARKDKSHSITPSPTTSARATVASSSSSKLPDHFYDTISSDTTSTNETITENPNFSSITNSTTTDQLNATKIAKSNKQKYFCNQHFQLNIEDNDSIDEVMARSKYFVKQYEVCQSGEDWGKLKKSNR